MNIFLEDEEVSEIKIEDIISKNDKGKVIVENANSGKRGEGKEELIKELVAYDSLIIGPRAAGEIYGVTENSAGKYSNGNDIKDENIKTNILAARHNIADKAIASLMQTLNLFDPTAINKQKDIIDAASKLASIVEKVTTKDRTGSNEVHLYLVGPKQNKIDRYDVIDV